ncbi:MAG: GNAT family N-acetyltransferase [Chloroflexota bacterium]|nr:GNAT family N-acetyltransferase [Chloroflexota bacterium]
MGINIRPVCTEDEWRQHSFVAAYAFNGDRGDDARDRKGAYYDWDWTLAAFDGDQLVAGLVVIPFEQYMEGAAIPLGGVACVSCLPERRRAGYVSALLRRSLESMRDAGQVLSALWTPHYSLYRKYGWEVSGRMISYAFPPKVTKLRRQASAGRSRRVTADDWALLDGVYRAYHRPRSGALARTEARWRTQTFRAFGHAHDAVLWEDSSGRARGYALYRAAHRPSGSSPWGETTLRVADWAALDADAYAGILQYLLNHDLVDQIVMLASADEPLPDMFDEPVHIKQPASAWFGPMLRVVDVPRALEARPTLQQASGTAVTIALTDASAPWNEGNWHIETSGGHIAAERTTAKAELEMDVCALAPIYNGFTKPVDAVRAGSVRARSAEAVDAATRIFATSFAPYCADDF